MGRVAAETLFRARRLRRRLTNAETILWSKLRHGVGGMKFRRQHPIGSYIADFAYVAARLVVEIDGVTHGSDAERRHDSRREAYLRSRAWNVIRVANDDVYHSLAVVLDLIYYDCHSRV
jgi:very-short-patch-repair endonuclease